MSSVSKVSNVLSKMSKVSRKPNRLVQILRKSDYKQESYWRLKI